MARRSPGNVRGKTDCRALSPVLSYPAASGAWPQALRQSLSNRKNKSGSPPQTEETGRVRIPYSNGFVAGYAFKVGTHVRREFLKGHPLGASGFQIRFTPRE